MLSKRFPMCWTWYCKVLQVFFYALINKGFSIIVKFLILWERNRHVTLKQINLKKKGNLPRALVIFCSVLIHVSVGILFWRLLISKPFASYRRSVKHSEINLIQLIHHEIAAPWLLPIVLQNHPVICGQCRNLHIGVPGYQPRKVILAHFFGS